MIALSTLSPEEIAALPAKQIQTIVYAWKPEERVSADAAFLLGGPEEDTPDRVRWAAELYRTGGVKLLIPTGGVLRGGRTEAENMEAMLLAAGVPKSAILLENAATITEENMTLSYPLALGALGQADTVCIVTSRYHMTRAMHIARRLLPKAVTVKGFSGPVEDWQHQDAMRRKVLAEAWLLGELIRRGALKEIYINMEAV